MSSLFMSSSESELTAEGPEFGSLALHGKGLEIMACIAPEVKQLRDLHSPSITRIEWCKSRISPYHEFIIAYSDKWVLLVERLIAYPDGRTPMQVTEEQQPPVPDDERAMDDLTKEEKAKILPDEALATETTAPPSPGTEMPPGTTIMNGAKSQSCTCPRNPKTGAQIQPRSLPSHYPRKSFASSSVSSSLDSMKNFSPLQTRESQDTLWLGDLHLSTVVENRKITHRYDVMSILTLHNSFSISELAVLAYVVHRHAPAYSLLEYQCYWYAKMVYNYVKESVGGIEDLQPCASDCGTFGTLPVPKGHRNSLEMIKQQFKVKWDHFHKKLLRELQVKENKEQKEKAEREAEQQRVKGLEEQADRDRVLREEAELEAARQKKLKEEAELEVARLKEEADRDKKRAEDREQQLQRDFKALRAQFERSPTVRA